MTKSRKLEPFGFLLMLDLYGCKPGTAGDLTLCYEYLNNLVDFLGMTKQSPPFIFVSPLEYPEKAGLSGWVPLIESGIQIHTLVPKNFISIDVYSFHKFSPIGVEEYTSKIFQPQKVEKNFILRGIKYNAI